MTKQGTQLLWPPLPPAHTSAHAYTTHIEQHAHTQNKLTQREDAGPHLRPGGDGWVDGVKETSSLGN